MKKTGYSIIVAAAAATLVLNACKKKEESAPKPQAKIAYAIYGVGLYDSTGSAKAAEWLNRGEMVTVTDTVVVPDAKNPKKSTTWAKIERTTGKQGYVVNANLESKAFVVVQPLEVFNINQAAGKRLATVPPGQIGFIVEEKGEWAKVRFGYHVYEDWSSAPEAKKWVEQKWVKFEGVSFDPVTIGQGIELESAIQRINGTDAKKREAGIKELRLLVTEGKTPFLSQAQTVLSRVDDSGTPPADTSLPSTDIPPMGAP